MREGGRKGVREILVYSGAYAPKKKFVRGMIYSMQGVWMILGH